LVDQLLPEEDDIQVPEDVENFTTTAVDNHEPDTREEVPAIRTMESSLTQGSTQSTHSFVRQSSSINASSGFSAVLEPNRSLPPFHMGSTDGVRQARDFQLSRQGSRSRSSSANSELRTDVVALGSGIFSDWLRVRQIELEERKLEAKMEADERRKEADERRKEADERRKEIEDERRKEIEERRQRYEEERARENQRRLDEIERENQRREDDRARDQRRHEEFILFMATIFAPKNDYKNNENAKKDG